MRKGRGFTRAHAKYAPPDSWGRERNSFPRMAATIVYEITAESVTGKQAALPAMSGRWPQKKPPG